MLISGELIKQAIVHGATKVVWNVSDTKGYEGQVIRYYFLNNDDMEIASYCDDLFAFFPEFFTSPVRQWHKSIIEGCDYQKNLLKYEEYQNNISYNLMFW